MLAILCADILVSQAGCVPSFGSEAPQPRACAFLKLHGTRSLDTMTWVCSVGSDKPNKSGYSEPYLLKVIV